MSRTEIANYDWVKWREEWMQKRKKENDKIIEKMLYKIANSGVDDEVTRSAKAFVRKLEETKKLKNQKVKKKVKHTTKHIQSNTLTVERNAIDDFVRIAQKKKSKLDIKQG